MRLKKKIIYILCGSLFVTGSFATVKKIKASGGFVKIYGTSSLHDWTVTGYHLYGSIAVRNKRSTATSLIDYLLKEENNQLNAKLRIPVAYLKSGKSGMDDKMKEALKYEKNKFIHFSLSKISKIRKVNDHGLTFIATGNLTIAGKIKLIPLKVSLTKKLKKYYFRVKKKFKMTNFKIKPPKAMLGVISTGDEVTINILWILKAIE